MALRNEEVVRIKYELGYNVTNVGADAYIQYSAVFDAVVQPYLTDIATTSNTTVVATPAGALATIAVASNPLVTPNRTQTNAFVLGSNVVIGLGSSEETSIVEGINGLDLTLFLFKAHSGTYQVKVQGAEQIIRDCFDRLDQIKNEMLTVAPKTAGLAALVGEIEFFSSSRNNRKGGRSKFEDLIHQRTVARRDLAGALGVPYLYDIKGTSGGGGTFEVY